MDQENEGSSCAETREMSGEDGEPFGGRRVGVSMLRGMSWEWSSEEEMEDPRESEMEEYQAGS